MEDPDNGADKMDEEVVVELVFEVVDKEILLFVETRGQKKLLRNSWKSVRVDSVTVSLFVLYIWFDKSVTIVRQAGLSTPGGLLAGTALFDYSFNETNLLLYKCIYR